MAAPGTRQRHQLSDQAMWFDELLIPAAEDGRIWATDLLYAERVWLVTRLTARGHSIRVICEQLRISRRTAQRLRAAGRQHTDG